MMGNNVMQVYDNSSNSLIITSIMNDSQVRIVTVITITMTNNDSNIKITIFT